MAARRNVNAGAGTSGESPIERETLRQRIEQRAYFRYCERGCVPGWELADWLAAEQEVVAERPSAGTTASSGGGEDPLGGGRPARHRTRRR